MKKYLLIASVLFLSACTVGGMTVSNPFSTTTDASSVYTSQFFDVPIPMGMESNAKGTLTTINSDGQKIGRETFSGRVEHNSLGAAMAHNLKNQGWSMIGVVQGERTLQLHQKGGRYLIVTVEDGSINSSMELWMITQVGQSPGMVEEVFDFGQQDLNNPSGVPQNIQTSTPSATPLPSSDFESFGSESLLK